MNTKREINLEAVAAGMDPTKTFHRLSTSAGSVLLVTMSGADSVEFYETTELESATPGTPAHRKMTSKWFWEASQKLAETAGGVPRPIAYVSELDAVLCEYIDGERLSGGVQVNEREAAARLTEWLWRLQQSGATKTWASWPETLALGGNSLKAEMEEFLGEIAACGFGTTADLMDLQRPLLTLSETVAAQPRALIHRDMTTNNVIVQNTTGELIVLDFLDVCYGPRAYDFASLLWDRSSSRDTGLTIETFEVMDTTWRGLGGKSLSWEEVAEASAHRLVKSAGRRLRVYQRTHEPAALEAAKDRLRQASSAGSSAGSLGEIEYVFDELLRILASSPEAGPSR